MDEPRRGLCGIGRRRPGARRGSSGGASGCGARPGTRRNCAGFGRTMRTEKPRVLAIALAATMLSACDLPPMLSDTGYRGTWQRGNVRNISLVAITEVGGRWYFRWTKRSFDGRLTVLCEWDG